MTIPLRFNRHVLRNHRYDHRHMTMLTTTTTTMMMMTAMMLVVVLGDYPPPSEDSLGYYSNNRNNRGGGGGGGGDGYISDWSSEWDNLGNPNPGKCIDIPSNLTLCANIGYTKMRLPNLLEHDTLKEVSQQAISWVRLLGLRCHADTQIFLCSLFAPVCLERPIWPCRSLCESVKAGCESRMLTYGFPWPEMLRCGQFPADDDLCIGLRNDSQKDRESSCSACISDTFESTVDHYCRAEFVMRIKVKQAIVTGTDMKIDTDKKKKLFKTGPLRTNELRDSSLFLAQGSSCECSALDGVGGGGGSGKGKNGSSSNNFIVMGSVTGGDRLVLSFVHRVDQKSKDVNRALRVARRSDVCTKSAAVLEAEQSGGVGSSSSSEGKKGGSGTKSGKKKTKGKKTTPTGKEARIKGSSTATTTAEWKSATTPKSRAAAATTTAARRKTQQSGKTAGSKQQQQQQKKKATTADPKRF